MNYFCDNRDGRRYETIAIDGLIWMAENLAYKGDDVTFGLPPNGQDWCLYNHECAVKACPPGWRLPTREEWQGLAQGELCCDKLGLLRLWAKGWMTHKGEWHVSQEMPEAYYWSATRVGQWGWWTLRCLDHGAFDDAMMECELLPVRCVRDMEGA